MRLAKNIFILIALYFLALAALYFFQRKILYHPELFYTPLAQAGANRNFQEIDTHTDDGLTLKAWYAPASSKPLTFVFFHGNGDRLRTVVHIADPYIDAGYGFLAVEYRGYSGMPGNPSEIGIYNDARAAIKALIASGVQEKNIVLFGQSLGTGVAVQMATEFKVAGVILASPYLSIGKVAQERYPIFPAELLVKDRFESFEKIARIKTPLLIVHGEKDNVVPASQGQKLYELAQEPKTLHLFPDAGHNDLFASGLWSISLDWLEHLPKGN